MNDITKDTFPKAKLHPMLDSLPIHLKDPANYEKIVKAILDAGATKHSHAEVVDWAGCRHCQSKQLARLEMMKRLGFKNGTQYLYWKKVHDAIKGYAPLPKYNDENLSSEESVI